MVPLRYGDHVISNLYLSALAQDSGDTAPLYCWALNGVTNTFENITIQHDGTHPSVHDFPPNGIFFDGETAGQILRNVQVYGAVVEPFRSNPRNAHYVLENVSWKSGFDSQRVRLSESGVGPSFPYPLRGGLSITQTAGGVLLTSESTGFPKVVLTAAELAPLTSWRLETNFPVQIRGTGRMQIDTTRPAALFKRIDYPF